MVMSHLLINVDSVSHKHIHEDAHIHRYTKGSEVYEKFILGVNAKCTVVISSLYNNTDPIKILVQKSTINFLNRKVELTSTCFPILHTKCN